MMMLDGDTPKSSKCWMAEIVWCSCFGKGCSGTRAVGRINNKFRFHTLQKDVTIVEHGNPDGTLVLLMKGLEHVKVIDPGRNDIAST
jgi:hypothetical protein